MQAVPASDWNALLAEQAHATPFMRHEYLAALESSGSASAETGWLARPVTLWQGDALVGACPLYLKGHSYGEYVFDWAWARAYEEHGLNYFPKAVIAVPFTPVPGARVLAPTPALREAVLRAAQGWCEAQNLSSLHLLFPSDEDLAASDAVGLMQRHGVQFHWTNDSYADWDAFLARLTQEKRKKIRQERRRVHEAGVQFRSAKGADITAADWQFFYQCYERTYLEHGNPPYLRPDFFMQMASHLADNWLLFIAEREGRPIACSLIALGSEADGTRVAYGRYWGALERVDSLHFEACYYQPIAWCIDHGIHRFEGGAQGEHKMARALMPTPTHSAHWLAHPAFAQAVDRFLARESEGIEEYLQSLQQRSPLRGGGA
jgi:predicted N-acyltransferase